MKQEQIQRTSDAVGGIDVRRADADDLERWNRYVERSPHGYVFHRLDALRLQASHADAELHPLVGYEGGEPVGLFPVFEISKMGVSTAFSPPPNLWVSRLGPVLLGRGAQTPQEAERRNREFVWACLDWVRRELAPKYTHVRTPGGYLDVRPFGWREFEVVPRFTYVVDLSPGEEIMSSFSSDARNNIRNADEDRYEIVEADASGIDRIIRQVARRHEEQGEPYALEPPFVRDLHEHLPAGSVRPYVCRVDGEFAGGIISVEDGETVYRWQGGAKPSSDLPVNDLLDWRIMRDAIDRGLDRYDLVGANQPRISKYKAKFGPDLELYYSLERSNRAMKLLSQIYKRLR